MIYKYIYHKSSDFKWHDNCFEAILMAYDFVSVITFRKSDTTIKYFFVNLLCEFLYSEVYFLHYFIVPNIKQLFFIFRENKLVTF